MLHACKAPTRLRYLGISEILRHHASLEARMQALLPCMMYIHLAVQNRIYMLQGLSLTGVLCRASSIGRRDYPPLTGKSLWIIKADNIARMQVSLCEQLTPCAVPVTLCDSIKCDFLKRFA